MARTNKFKAKPGSSAPASKSKQTTLKPTKATTPAALGDNSNSTTLEEPRPASRRRLDKNPWSDGDHTPQFAAVPSLPSALAPIAHPTLPTQAQAPAPALAAPTATAAAAITARSPTDPIDPLALLPSSLGATIAEKYDPRHLPIGASSKITSKVTALLALLENDFSLAQMDQKPAIVAVTARAAFANRMLSVVEIAKRELVGRKSRWFQYSAVAGRVEEMREKAEGLGRSGEEKENEVGPDVEMGGDAVKKEAEMGEEGEEEEAFETMQFESEERPMKVRAVPVMTIYLSRVPIPELKAEFGEQTFDPRPPLML